MQCLRWIRTPLLHHRRTPLHTPHPLAHFCTPHTTQGLRWLTLTRRCAQQLREVDLPTRTTPRELSKLLGVRTVDVLKVMIRLGERPQSANDTLPPDLIDIIASEFDCIPRRDSTMADLKPRRLQELTSGKQFPRRWPIVGVLGHINHGLDSNCRDID